MRQLNVNGFTWLDVIDWVLSNGWCDHIVHEDDISGLAVFLIWTKPYWEEVREKWRDTMKHTNRIGHHGGFTVNLYLSDEAEIHYRMKFD